MVALCLHRITQPSSVKYRAPVSESLTRLQREQLQKFAQYLIAELADPDPKQILPTAQRILDELLNHSPSSESSIMYSQQFCIIPTEILLLELWNRGTSSIAWCFLCLEVLISLVPNATNLWS